MKKGQLKKGATPYAPRVTESSFYPDVDSTYTMRDYSGDRIEIPMPTHKLGIKAWSSLPTQAQGMAIYGDILVRMFNVTKSTTHYIYQIAASGGLNQVATFSCSTSGHSNSIQFAPTIESGNAFPYFYVDYLEAKCTVFSISAQYVVTQVQTITAPDMNLSFLHIGDDGHIWGLSRRSSGAVFYKRFRKVEVSEGEEVTLTSGDVIDEFEFAEKFLVADGYTFQGWKIKYGKIWLPIGTTGSDEKRAIVVYDIGSKRLVSHIDLTSLGDIEFEDLDFWDGAVILCTYATNTYILRF